MIKTVSFASLLTLWTTATVVTADVALPLPMFHPQDDFEPVFLRKYVISKEEAATLPFCASTETHGDCNWGLMVLLRQESCIPNTHVLEGLMHDQDNAPTCPLLIQGFSIYDTDNTSPTAKPHKHAITNQPGVALPVFIFDIIEYEEWEKQQDRAFTYQDFVEWADAQPNVYKGVAYEYFEAHSSNVNLDDVDIDLNFTRTNEHLYDEGDLTVMVKGVLEKDHEFTFTIDEVGDTYKPIIWDVVLTNAKAYKAQDEDGLEGGGLAGAIIGSILFGAILGALGMKMTMGGGSNNNTTTTTTSAALVASSMAPHKDVEDTEVQEHTETQA